MNKGFIESFYHNGSALFEGGICIPNNKKEGSHYAKIAAMNGFPGLMWHYATLLKNGIGVESDIQLHKAIGKGILVAMNNYACRNQNGEGVFSSME